MKKVVLVVPVYNEEKILEKSIIRLYNYFLENIEYDWKIIIANNASKDRTREISERLVTEYPKIDLLNIEKKGRGRALKSAWSNIDADAYAYCDVDLATDINQTKILFDLVLKDNYDIVTGNRYLKSSNSKRTKDRWVYSKIYIYMSKILFNTKLTDFQCGFKSISKRVAIDLIPRLKNNEFFLDTELLLLGEKAGYKIKQLPVNWKEMRVRESKVNVLDTGLKYTRDIIGLKLKNPKIKKIDSMIQLRF